MLPRVVGRGPCRRGPALSTLPTPTLLLTPPVDLSSPGLRRRDRLIAHVYTHDDRHVQVALYGWKVVSGATAAHRRTATWEAAVYADTEEPLDPVDEERWQENLVAAVLTRAGG